MVTKYIVVEDDNNLKPFKILSRHSTLQLAKRGLTNSKPSRNSKGVSIYKML